MQCLIAQSLVRMFCDTLLSAGPVSPDSQVDSAEQIDFVNDLQFQPMIQPENRHGWTCMYVARELKHVGVMYANLDYLWGDLPVLVVMGGACQKCVLLLSPQAIYSVSIGGATLV